MLPLTQVTKAYHALARETHPEQGGSAERFREVQLASPPREQLERLNRQRKQRGIVGY